MYNRQKIVEILIKRGTELLNEPYKKIEFTGNSEADDLLNNIENFPHAFVLACIMDRQIKSKKAWLIPYEISKEIGVFEFSRLLQMRQNDFKEIFKRKNLHRFNNIMAENFYSAIQLIHTKYQDNASNIWKDNPKSATIVQRFLEFNGVGVKISTMAANILAREFKIPMQDRVCIDISPDVQVKRVFTGLGFISQDAGDDELIYCARKLHPEYPGIFDLSAWEIGRKWCRPNNPDCNNCYLKQFCPSNSDEERRIYEGNMQQRAQGEPSHTNFEEKSPPKASSITLWIITICLSVLFLVDIYNTRIIRLHQFISIAFLAYTVPSVIFLILSIFKPFRYYLKPSISVIAISFLATLMVVGFLPENIGNAPPPIKFNKTGKVVTQIVYKQFFKI